MFSVIACIRDDHDWRLIVAAAIVCLAGSVATMLLLLRAERSEGGQRSLWVAASGLACGFGVWSTHFIAMLAYDGGVQVSYGLWGTALSMVVAIAASWIAFAIFVEAGARSRSIGRSRSRSRGRSRRAVTAQSFTRAKTSMISPGSPDRCEPATCPTVHIW